MKFLVNFIVGLKLGFALLARSIKFLEKRDILDHIWFDVKCSQEFHFALTSVDFPNQNCYGRMFTVTLRRMKPLM